MNMYATSLLNVKEITENDTHYLIKGMATTPTPDAVGDIVEPMGAEFKLPMPLLWMHKSEKPVGLVTFAKPKKSGIPFHAELPKVKEAGALRERIEEAVQSMRYRLVAAVSIGFMPVQGEMELLKDGGIRFLQWVWKELSLVTIPANSEATLEFAKSISEQNLPAASGAERKKLIEMLQKKSPGASGKPAIQIKGKTIMNYKEQIAAAEASRETKKQQMAELMKAATEKGLTLDADQQTEFDELQSEVEGMDAHIKRLQTLEKLNITTAAPVNGEINKSVPAGSAARVSINAKLEPGIKFARMAQCIIRAKYLQKEGQYFTPDQIYQSEKRWMDTAPDVGLALKAAVNGLTSNTSGAASEWAYAQNIATEFVEYLRPLTLLGKIQGWRNVPFNIRVGGMDGGSTGYWVGEGLAIPVSKPTSTSISLGITKVGAICTITKELAMLSDPSAELMIRNDLGKAIAQKADTSLIDPNSGGVANVTPQSLTYGATARQASGTDFAALKADWKALTAPFYAANIPLSGAVVIMKEELAEALSLMVTSLGLPQFPSMQDWASGNGRFMGRPVFTTQAADTSGSPDFDNMLILLQPGEVFLADNGGASIEASDQVSIEMDNAPGNKSSATATGASLVSMFQTESLAIKGLRHVNWTKARSQACQYIRSAAYV